MREPSVVRADAMPAGTPECRVAIVGAGACGLAAACFLHDAGTDDVVLLERDAAPAGSTALSSGFVPAAGTRVQRAAGVMDDDAERFAADIQCKAGDRAAAHLVRAFTDAAPRAIDALGERHGLAFELLDGFLYPGHTRARMHTLAARTGAALVGALAAAAEAAGATLVSRARVVELSCDASERVIGLGFERPGGALEHLACRALLLACNGFGGNPSLVREHLGAFADAPFAGHRGNDGSAVVWGRALGARLADLGAAQGHGSWAAAQGVLITWAPMTQGAIQVNACGERFHDETGGYSEAATAVLAQPGGIAWDVFDARRLALARGFPDFRDAEAAGALRHAADARALAALIGCDAGTLAHTLAGTTLDAPYAAIKVTGALFHTQGGLDIDANGRVLRERDGTPLPNLLAAGGAARGVSGPGIDGYLSGNGLLSAIAGAWIAARTLHEESLA